MLSRLTFGFLVTADLLSAANPTFYADVLPILEKRCQECHRPGAMAPMPLLTYQQARPWAKAIRTAVSSRKMPPWLADPCCGKFANDRSLAPQERDSLIQWVDNGAPEGLRPAQHSPKSWQESWNLPSQPDLVLQVKQAFPVPAKGELEYQYFVVPTGFREDRWVSAVEARPNVPGVVHHSVVYVREPGDTWTKGPTKADILTIYAPGSSPDVLPPGMAKLVKAGSDLVIETHYTPNGKAAREQTRVAMIFAKNVPEKRVLTLQMDSSTFRIPPGERDYRVTVWGTLPNDALLVSMYPHMHLRGKSFEFLRIRDDGQPEVLLRVPAYDFYWQISYRLTRPLLLKKGTRLEWIAVYDNSRNNPRNPDPTVEVRYGHQSWEEMMVGFFDVAVDPRFDKNAFFQR